MFDYLSSLCARRDRAWDCATGNGQAAVEIANSFQSVIATDASAKQIESAIPSGRVEYRVASAEDSGLDSDSVDLLTVAQALHWFDIERYFGEARRVAVDNAILAAWCYGLCAIEPAIDAIVDELYSDLVDEFWPAERVIVEQGYRDIAFPGVHIEAPDFDMQISWRVNDMLSYLRTWSACQRYRSELGEDPVTIIEPALRAAWGNSTHCVRWPLTLRLCRL